MGLLSSSVDLVRLRLINQRLCNSTLETPAEVVRWMGAVQAQEYAMAKWAIALRLPSSRESQIENALRVGKILRTHILRPTWHFVTPEDIRWMLALSAPKIHATNRTMYSRLGLDKKIFTRCNDLLARYLENGCHKTRPELRAHLTQSKIRTDDLRLGYLMMQAEIDGVVCSGPRIGKQFTYALLEERAPLNKAFRFDREESLGLLAHRYFMSRGPATLQDFVSWSWLTVKDAKSGISQLDGSFVKEIWAGKEYIFKRTPFIPPVDKGATFLMPDYDEYGMGYRDRSAILNEQLLKTYQEGATSAKAKNPVFNRMIIMDGTIQGTWRRTIVREKTVVDVYPFFPLSKSKLTALSKAIRRFQAFCPSRR